MSKVIEMNSAIEAYLASGKKITILPPSRVKKSLKFPPQGHKFSQYNIGKKKMIARSEAAKKAA